MIILGLTGSIGSGKSLASKCFRYLGVPVHDADKCVHDLLSNDAQIIAHISKVWGKAVKDGAIQRPVLGEIVFSDFEELKRLESIIFPKLALSQQAFLMRHRCLRSPLVVLDVPLLFEVGLVRYCDVTVCIVADKGLRKRRVLKRLHMTAENLIKRESFQLSDFDKCKEADVLLRSGRHKGDLFRQIKDLVMNLRSHPTKVTSRLWPSTFSRV